MSKFRFTIALAALVILIVFSACQKTDTADGFDTLLFSDDTAAAAELISQANEDLNKIKVMYKKNEDQRDELIAAMGEKDVEKVKKITDDVVYLINDGMALGESAVEKIARAEQMNIDADFKQYLNLKEESLQKQLSAFESRRQAVRKLRDSFGTNDATLVEKAKTEVRQKEEVFVKTMEESRAVSKKANDLAKESSKRVKE